MNGDADEDLPEALRSRFPVRLRIEEVHPDAIKRLPEDLQAAARQTGGANVEIERRITIRSWLEFARLRPTVGLETAAAAVFGARADTLIEAMRLAEIAKARKIERAAAPTEPK
jgi:MoxR-like ATPase